MENDNLAWENKYAERMMPRIERVYAEFWFWAKANGYEIALGDMKKAWKRYSETELSEEDNNILFNGYFPDRMKREFNGYCAERIKTERAFLEEAKAI